MKHHFLCPNCKTAILLPACPACGYRIPQKGSIYYFCDDAGVKLEGEDQYIGYDNIGEDFEPTVAYYDANNVERYGVYEACGDLIAQTFGTDITVLDLGAGLGTASIPLAKNGIFTIAADISDVMLSTAEKRAKGRFDNLILARMNAYELMLPDHSVDIVVENAMLHLVDNPEKVIQEIVRVLKPDGKLVRYGSPGQDISEEEWKLNVRCNEILADLYEKYDAYLSEHHVKKVWFDNHFPEVLAKYFEPPRAMIAEGFTEVFVDKLKFRLHRVKTGALSDRQHVPKEILDAAWEYVDTYAKEKYGEAYIDIKSFSRYGASIDVYLIKK